MVDIYYTSFCLHFQNQASVLFGNLSLVYSIPQMVADVKFFSIIIIVRSNLIFFCFEIMSDA